MKTHDEIHRAHDLIISLMELKEQGELKNIVLPEQEMLNACSVLCWVLDHDHSQSFSDNLAALEKVLRDRNFFLHKPDHHREN